MRGIRGLERRESKLVGVHERNGERGEDVAMLLWSVSLSPSLSVCLSACCCYFLLVNLW